MRLFVVPLALLLIALGVPSYAQKGAPREVVVREGEPLRVECALRVEQRVEWRVEGGPPAPDLRAAEAPAPAGGVRAVLAAPAARLHHAGVYACARDAPAVRVLVLPATARARAGVSPASHGVEATTGATGVTGASETDDAGVEYTMYLYDVGRAIVLNCSSPAAPPGLVYTWSKNGTVVEQVEHLKDRHEKLEAGAVLRVKPRTNEDDYGDYACHVGGAVARAWRVHGRPVAKLPANVNVVEGQKLKVTCKVIGKPYPPVQWVYGRVDSDNETQVPVEEVAGARVTLRDSAAGVPRGELLLEGATRADAGNYSCVPPGGLPAHSILRVKGMYDALWPFLGICAEVFVLCAIILVYEKRRTKPELDDSDTDNHDQKKS